MVGIPRASLVTDTGAPRPGASIVPSRTGRLPRSSVRTQNPPAASVTARIDRRPSAKRSRRRIMTHVTATLAAASPRALRLTRVSRSLNSPLLDRYGARNANFVLVSPDRIAVLAARSAARDTGNQSRALQGDQGRALDWFE